jgi:GT2 family glycosyltransferase
MAQPGLRELTAARRAPGAPALSVVIPTRDRPGALEETLAGLDEQRCEPADVELIVVDNAPGAPTAARVAERRGRLPLRALAQPTPGPAAARNAGARAARAPVLLLLGDDMRPASSGLLAGHMALHAADPRPALGVLGRIEWRPDKPVSPFMHWLEHGGPQFDYASLAAGPVPAARSFYTSHVSVKAQALAAVGGFDERFPFAAVEDVEIGLRLERAGLELVYHDELVVQHDHQYAPAGFAARQERVGASARLLFELHGDRALLPTPSWTWALHRAARPALAALASRPLRPPLRERVWAALAMAGYASGWARSAAVLRGGGHLPGWAR